MDEEAVHGRHLLCAVSTGRISWPAGAFAYHRTGLDAEALGIWHAKLSWEGIPQHCTEHVGRKNPGPGKSLGAIDQSGHT